MKKYNGSVSFSISYPVSALAKNSRFSKLVTINAESK